MGFGVRFMPLAAEEIAKAYAWYGQARIGLGEAFIEELQRSRDFLALNPLLYPVVEQDLRRANLRRFPYALFFVVEGEQVSVLACFHQHRKPLTRADLLGP